MSTTSGAIEFSFELNDRGEIKQLSGIYADVKRLQNLLFSNDTLGTKGMPVNLNQYLRERATTDTLDEIRSVILTATSTFLPDISIQQLEVEVLETYKNDPNVVGTLFLYMQLGEYMDKPFAITAIETTRGELISRVVF